MPKVRDVLIERLEGEGYITVPEGSKRTAVAERSIRTWTRTGRVRVRRVGGLVFVEAASLFAAAGLPAPAAGATR